MIFSKKPPHDSVDGEEVEISVMESVDETEALEAQPEPRIQTPRKPTIISEGFEFIGTIVSEGSLNIAGVVKGKITAKSIMIDVEGQVEGEVNTESLMVKGRVQGDVQCQDLNVGPRARVDGDIAYQTIHIQRGGRVSGKFNRN
jgi:cytoskeletal protein CcmA (bactofilin family)